MMELFEELIEKNKIIESLNDDLMKASTDLAEKYCDLLGDYRALEAKQKRLRRRRGNEQFFYARNAKNRRRQLRELQEKVEAMKTWRGVVRTIGQKLGISK